jgi:hypothetical protein
MMPVYIIISVLFVAGIIAFSFFFSKRAIVKRRLRKMPHKQMSELQDGDIARVTGRISLCGTTFCAPFSGRKCSYYHIIVEQHHSGKNGGHWSLLVDEVKTGDVVITNGRTAAIVNTDSAEAYVYKDREYRSGFLNDPNPLLTEYLKNKGVKGVSWIGLNKTLRYQEGVLEEGEQLTVAGKVRWMRKSETSLDITADRILRIEPCEDKPVYFTDDAVN